jgi:hypothetical protein
MSRQCVGCALNVASTASDQRPFATVAVCTRRCLPRTTRLALRTSSRAAFATKVLAKS